MPIVASCGYYSQPFYPPKITTMTEDEIFADLVHTASTQPMGALGEIGTWDVMTADEKKVFRAVGRAHLATNLPIFTHTNFGKGAIEQLDVLESIGVKPQRVVIGHVGGLADPKVEAVKELCKRGAFVGYDRQGGAGDARNIAQVQALIEAGYTANLMFASDFSSAAQTVHNHQAGYAKTLTVFVPKLREAGVKEDALHQILVDNPRRFLAFVPQKPR
jgi:phosphotriesterase-related protein